MGLGEMGGINYRFSIYSSGTQGELITYYLYFNFYFYSNSNSNSLTLAHSQPAFHTYTFLVDGIVAF